MTTLQSLTKKIPKWCWYVFPAAILLFLFFALRNGGRGALRWLSPPSTKPPTLRPPVVTPEEREKEREKIKEAATDKRTEIKKQADEWRKRLE
jgi:hypothetical protein